MLLEANLRRPGLVCKPIAAKHIPAGRTRGTLPTAKSQERLLAAIINNLR